MDLGLTGRVAVVTGGNRGIGAETVRLLGEEGATAVAVSRANGIDVTALDAADQILERLDGRAPDILVNNAGTSYAKPLGELSEEDWQLQWDLNVMASMRLMRAFVPAMAERGWGRVVNVCSTAGKRPSAAMPEYSVAKAAELSLSRLFADRHAKSGVLVNAICPGPVESEMWMEAGGLLDQSQRMSGAASREEALASAGSKRPIGRLAASGEIASAIAFLCSERASYVVGAAWSVDGGTVQVII
jgi:3-oxoacyl-[acyl-carrier protein] reductase